MRAFNCTLIYLKYIVRCTKAVLVESCGLISLDIFWLAVLLLSDLLRSVHILPGLVPTLFYVKAQPLGLRAGVMDDCYGPRAARVCYYVWGSR